MQTSHLVRKNVNKRSLNKIYKCKICGLLNNNAWGLTLHMKRHNKDFKYKCKLCSASYVNNYELAKHVNSEHIKDKKYQCRFCPKMFKYSASKSLHEDVHGILKHKCRFCDEEFLSQIKRRVHQKSHHRDGEYSCKLCLKDFSDKDFLNRHLANSHVRALTCTECNILFLDTDDLAKHKTEHEQMKSKKTALQKKNERYLYVDSDFNIRTYVFRCVICSEEFNFKVDLTNHIESIHSSEKEKIFKFICSVCNKSFDEKSKLRGHMIGHGPKIHVCTQCTYRTARKKDLEKHIRVKHDLEKKYICAICNMAFLYRGTFTAHQLKHVNKKFRCDVCHDTFNDKNNLSQHKRLKHYVENTVCDQCGNQFTNPRSLGTHIKNIHNRAMSICLCNRCGITVTIKEISSHIKMCVKHVPDINRPVRLKLKGPTCSVCNVTFSTRSDALYHSKEVHSTTSVCKCCNSLFMSLKALEQHVGRHKPSSQNIRRNKVFKHISLKNLFPVNSIYRCRKAFNCYECFACGNTYADSAEISDHLCEAHCDIYGKEISSQHAVISLPQHFAKDYCTVYKMLKQCPDAENLFFIEVLPKEEFSDVLQTVLVQSLSTPLTDDKNNNDISKQLKFFCEPGSYQDILQNISSEKNSDYMKDLEAFPFNNIVKEEVKINVNDFMLAKLSHNSHSVLADISIHANSNTSYAKAAEKKAVLYNQLIEMLQQRTVTVDNSVYLPFNELTENLKSLMGIDDEPSATELAPH